MTGRETWTQGIGVRKSQGTWQGRREEWPEVETVSREPKDREREEKGERKERKKKKIVRKRR